MSLNVFYKTLLTSIVGCWGLVQLTIDLFIIMGGKIISQIVGVSEFCDQNGDRVSMRSLQISPTEATD